MGRRQRGIGARIARGLGYTVAGVAGLAVVAAAAGYAFLHASLPQLEGVVETPGLSSSVTVQRDVNGVPTLIAQSRVDMARTLGFLHGQERFFQMDLLRRGAAGELAELLGAAAIEMDKGARVHRFRARATDMLAKSSPAEREMLTAYADGVNQGLAALGARPFEYGILRQSPVPWRPEDTMLVTWAMFFDLQDDDGTNELFHQRAIAELGPDWADFLYPLGSSADAALDGSLFPDPPIPDTLPPPRPVRQALDLSGPDDPDLLPGSNNWAVAGALTPHGGAMVANDMHLGHSVPNIWYRARLVLTAADGEVLNDITGHTLPGTPSLVTGSNGHIAWAYTNSYIDTGDAVIIEPGASDGTYRTPQGDLPLGRVTERICAADGTCEELVVEETIWGPVVDTDVNGAKVAYRWVAHDAGAGALAGLLEMERARGAGEAVAIAQRSAIPNNNLVVGDRDGNIAWTIIGKVPARFGFDGRLPVSFADGTKGWNGYLEPGQIPVIANPDNGRIWTANARVVGGAAYAILGGDGYAHGNRAFQIRELLFAKDRFTEEDLLAIQLDDRNLELGPWQGMLLNRLRQTAGMPDADPRLNAMIPLVDSWGGRAVPDSVGYRLVRSFRYELVRRTVEAYRGIPDSDRPAWRAVRQNTAASVQRLLQARPGGLVPPGHDSWDSLLDSAIAAVLADVDREADGDLAGYSWGERNRPGVRHPMSRFVPGLAVLTDPADDPVPGDAGVPRAQGRGFGASERTVVSPGREQDGIAHMPGSQSGHPLAPYYLTANAAWREGRATPFLPGPTEWEMRFEPAYIR